MVLGWARGIAPRVINRLIGVTALGVMLSTYMSAVIFLPAADAAELLNNLGLMIVSVNLFGTSALALMVMREQELVDYEGLLTQAATTDPLTTALNRKTVVDRYERLAIPDDPRRGVAIFCIDIDHFKLANDLHERLIGDRVLVEMTDRMKACLRPSDLFARMSGDKFLIVLGNVSLSNVKTVAERCRSAVFDTPIDCGVVDVPITISLGTAWAATNDDFDEQRAAADAALYRAKAKGRDCIALDDAPDLFQVA